LAERALPVRRRAGRTSGAGGKSPELEWLSRYTDAFTSFIVVAGACYTVVAGLDPAIHRQARAWRAEPRMTEDSARSADARIILGFRTGHGCLERQPEDRACQSGKESVLP
jgi:hypothetical protein